MLAEVRLYLNYKWPPLSLSSCVLYCRENCEAKAVFGVFSHLCLRLSIASSYFSPPSLLQIIIDIMSFVGACVIAVKETV